MMRNIHNPIMSDSVSEKKGIIGYITFFILEPLRKFTCHSDPNYANVQVMVEQGQIKSCRELEKVLLRGSEVRPIQLTKEMSILTWKQDSYCTMDELCGLRSSIDKYLGEYCAWLERWAFANCRNYLAWYLGISRAAFDDGQKDAFGPYKSQNMESHGLREQSLSPSHPFGPSDDRCDTTTKND